MTTWLSATRPTAEVVGLDDDEALDAAVVGSKAANLARARRVGLPSLGGFVLPVDLVAEILAGADVPVSARQAYRQLSDGGRRPVVVRSSSPVEDTAGSSQAGRFTSVVDVRGLDAFVDAVARVAVSGDGLPMAVLVQRHVDPAVSGVAFGVDPVSGRADRQVVAAVRGGPQALVAGAVTGDRYELGRRGRLVALHTGDGGTDLRRAERRAVARLATTAASAFGGPQDIEWARTDGGDTLLLQSRPVTMVAARARGPRFAPGPLAETFPTPLTRLEQDLWLAPLRAAVVETAVLTGRASRRRAERSPVVVAPGGRAAIDVDLVGAERRTGFVAALDPRPGLRRLAAAWRVGRVGAAFEGLAADVLADADAALAGVPALDGLDDESLLQVLDRGVVALVSLHGHEVLAGALTGDEPANPVTGAEVALHALRLARLDGLDDDAARARHPEVLALSTPALGQPAPLPADPPALRAVSVDDLGPREALRLRIRWVHELMARSAVELGRRLATRGVLPEASAVRHLDRESLDRSVRLGAAVAVVPSAEGPPLPTVFQLADDGTVVASRTDADGDAAGVGAGGGRGAGPVHHGANPPPGSVLVTDVLDPALAVHLPRLAGLVAESGSPLSHLAILAREHGVATVVGAAGARRRWAPGEVVAVDGATGVIEPLQARAHGAPA